VTALVAGSRGIYSTLEGKFVLLLNHSSRKAASLFETCACGTAASLI
jgi:hypothetical protein